MKTIILLLKNNILKSLLLLLFIISSCSPEFKIEDSDTPTNEEEITMNNLTGSPDFDWKTFTDIELTMTANTNNIVKVLSATGVLYQQAFLSKDNAYMMKLTVPTYETTVRLLFNEQDVTIDISSGKAEYTFQ